LGPSYAFDIVKISSRPQFARRARLGIANSSSTARCLLGSARNRSYTRPESRCRNGDNRIRFYRIASKRRPKMAPIHFVPAHNPRHRSAAFALYRALLRLSRQVAVPSQRPDSLSNPISQRIRCRFDANRTCWSNRLVYAALAAGYQVSPHALNRRSLSSPPSSFAPCD
jgi:hypothetical protein